MAPPPVASKALYAQIKALGNRARARRESNCFLVEGPVLLADALASGLTVRTIATADPESVHTLDVPTTCEVFSADRDRLGRSLTTDNPRPIVGIVEIPASTDPGRWASGPVLALVDIAEPGNAGTMIRTAEAAGLSGVILVGSGVDVWNPKVVRAAAGSLFRLPTAALEVEEFFAATSAPRRRIATVVSGGKPHDSVDLTDAIICVGNEARGLDDSFVARCDDAVSIELAGPTESLNAAAAAAVIVFAALGQRRTATLNRPTPRTTT